MVTFTAANQVRLAIKMKLSMFEWYVSSRVRPMADDYAVIIGVRRIDNAIRKIVSPVVDGVDVKLEID